jgi:RimJ/RimL family protein N-acetyltransferase
MTNLLETNRLRLRAFSSSDADRLCELDNDADVMRWINGASLFPRKPSVRKSCRFFYDTTTLYLGVDFGS